MNPKVRAWEDRLRYPQHAGRLISMRAYVSTLEPPRQPGSNPGGQRRGAPSPGCQLALQQRSPQLAYTRVGPPCRLSACFSVPVHASNAKATGPLATSIGR